MAFTIRRLRPDLHRSLELIVHLARREAASTHRFTLLGAGWPLIRLLAQWGTLAFVFGRLVRLSIVDYPVFLIGGLLTWTWFATGVLAGTSALISKRHLVFQPRLPSALLPAVSVAVSSIDVLVALPAVLIVVLSTTSLHWSILFLPVLIAVQVVLMSGVVWLTSVATVYLRDTRALVEVGLTLLFYLTPVFYDVHRTPHALRPFLYINPMTTLVDGWRSVLIEGRLPDALGLAVVAVASCALAAVALVVFRRLEGGLVDEL
jgi:lipopolysaccharide transport system permease protein